MTEKMGQTIAASGQSDVTVIGYGCSHVSTPGLTGVPLGQFQRLGFSRWLARWRVYGLASRLRPQVLIFSTHELIFPAILLKVIYGTRIIYDVRENYHRNILHSEGLPAFLRWPLAVWVRFIEKLAAPAIDHFFLAEAGYEKEFRFFRGGWTVIENKATNSPRLHETFRRGRPPAPSLLRREGVLVGTKLLFTGTLSESSGVFRAIRFAEKLHHYDATVRLTVIGYAASKSIQRRLREEASKKPFVQLVGIENLVPHAEITTAFCSADAAIISYPNLPQTVNSLPTKLFEYLQANLPILTEPHWPWVARFAWCQPFALCNMDEPNAIEILNMLKTNSFYTSTPPDTSWSSEAPKLLTAIKNIV